MKIIFPLSSIIILYKHNGFSYVDTISEQEQKKNESTHEGGNVNFVYTLE